MTVGRHDSGRPQESGKNGRGDVSAKAHYFKIGLFVIIGVVLFVLALIVLGADLLFRERILLETYIDESIQGVDVGTAVKFRGVSIGNVRQVDFVYNVYQPDTEPSPDVQQSEPFRYVYLLMEVDPKVLGRVDSSSIPAFLDREVRRGLRIRMTPQGLTGLFFLELDYFDPDRYPPPPIEWEPAHHYIPSARSTITFFIESIAEVFGRLERIDLAGVVDEVTATLQKMQQTLDDAEVATLSRELQGTIASLRDVSDELLTLVRQPALQSLSSETLTLISTTRRQIESSGEQIDRIGDELTQTLAGIRAITERINGYMDSERAGEDLDQLRATLESLSQAAATLPGSLDRTLGRAERLIEGQQHDMQLLLENFRQISENLRALSEQARENPSGILFGDPPPPVNFVPER